MQILIDADGCPVVDHAIRIAAKHKLRCKLICDTSHYFSREGAETITVSKGADSADYAIVNSMSKGDIVVTQDYGLAAMVLARGGHPVTQNGLIIQDDNISSMLESRHAAKRIRSGGGRLKGPSKRTKAQDEAFCSQLEHLITYVI